MGRPRRHFLPGVPVHVTQRGNNRQAVFRSEGDYRYLWRCLSEAVADGCADVNAYVFMTNHIHLVITPHEVGAIARVMHSATRRYASYFNKRYERTGTLWEGRYRPSRIYTDSHFLNCHRYVDLNPVRGGLTANPEDYAWSSHRYYALGERNPLVRPHQAMLRLATAATTLEIAYRQLFQAPLTSEDLEMIRSCSRASRDMGDPPRTGRPRKVNLAPFFVS